MAIPDSARKAIIVLLAKHRKMNAMAAVINGSSLTIPLLEKNGTEKNGIEYIEWNKVTTKVT